MKNNSSNNQAMTLIEMMVTVAIIGMLLLLVVPSVKKAMEHRQNALVASKMRIAINAFELCKGDTGSYPEDVSRCVVPPEMTDYFANLGIDWWSGANELGASWDWDKNNNYKYSVSFVDPRPGISEKQFKELDLLLNDDGDLTTGSFRKNGTRYQYILEE